MKVLDPNSAGLSPKRGTITRVRGSVIDARFTQGMPDLNNELRAGDDDEVVIEVIHHLNTDTVRGIAMTPTQGLARGCHVVDRGRSMQVPLDRLLLGRAFNVCLLTRICG